MEETRYEREDSWPKIDIYLASVERSTFLLKTAITLTQAVREEKMFLHMLDKTIFLWNWIGCGKILPLTLKLVQDSITLLHAIKKIK